MTWLISNALLRAYENSPCSQGQEAESSAATCSGGDASAPLNVMPTPQPFWRNDKTMDVLSRSPFGLTWRHLTEQRGEALLTWFRGASRARTSAWPEAAKGSAEAEAGCGGKWRGSFARFDPDTSTWRTLQLSLLEDSELYSETWPRWGSMRNGVAYPLHPKVPRTSGTESGSWPTLTVCGNYNRKGASKTSGDGLATAVAQFPTPCARDYRSPGRSRLERTGGKQGENLPQVVGGRLNPAWVEWLMNWPLGWTALEPLKNEIWEFWKESSAAFIQGNALQSVWFDRDPSTPPQGQEPHEQLARECRGSVSEMPQGGSHGGRDLGERNSGTRDLQGMRGNVPTETHATILDLQPGVPIGVGADQRTKALGFAPRTASGVTARVDRLKALGNGQVSRVAAAAWRLLSE